jgi:RNA polymerase sigma-70 factor (ECF subfamily)
VVGPAGDDEARLVERAQAGDRDALDDLLRRQYERTYALCRRLAGNDHDALDATQEALIAIVRGLPRYDGRARFSTWSYRVSTNACLDELRRRRRRPQPFAVDAADPTTGHGAPSLDERVADRLAIDAAMVELAPTFRTAVVLRDVLGLDYAEIAEVLEVPIGTVRSRLARGRRQLADRLSGNPDRAATVEERAP